MGWFSLCIDVNINARSVPERKLLFFMPIRFSRPLSALSGRALADGCGRLQLLCPGV
jgi:hypothetical protein